MQRISVIFRGRVQGVGFRQTTAEIAEGFAVTGTVRNLPDGDVELIAEGSADDLQLFIAAIEKRMNRHIQSRRQRQETATDEFSDFRVIH